eukprot:3028478-Prymnesium_polylepis.1
MAELTVPTTGGTPAASRESAVRLSHCLHQPSPDPKNVVPAENRCPSSSSRRRSCTSRDLKVRGKAVIRAVQVKFDTPSDKLTARSIPGQTFAISSRVTANSLRV